MDNGKPSTSIAEHKIIGLTIGRHSKRVAWVEAMGTCEALALCNGSLESSDCIFCLFPMQAVLSKNLDPVKRLVLGGGLFPRFEGV